MARLASSLNHLDNQYVDRGSMEENNENLASEFSWKRHVKKGHRALQQLLVFLAEEVRLNLIVRILGILEIAEDQPGHGG